MGGWPTYFYLFLPFVIRGRPKDKQSLQSSPSLTLSSAFHCQLHQIFRLMIKIPPQLQSHKECFTSFVEIFLILRSRKPWKILCWRKTNNRHIFSRCFFVSSISLTFQPLSTHSPSTLKRILALKQSEFSRLIMAPAPSCARLQVAMTLNDFSRVSQWFLAFVSERSTIDVQSEYVRFTNCCSSYHHSAIAFSSHVRIHQQRFACVRYKALMEFPDQFIDIWYIFPLNKIMCTRRYDI
jgi:hypothetical protein